MLKLAHKGLLIVLLPVVFEGAFLWRVQGLLHEVDTQIARESQIAHSLVLLQSFLNLASRASFASISFRAFGDHRYFDEHEHIVTSMVSDAKQLLELTKDDSALHTHIVGMIHGQAMHTRFRRAMMRDPSVDDPHVSEFFGGSLMIKFVDYGQGASERNFEQWEMIQDKVRQRLENATQKSIDETQRTLNRWLIGGALISALLTALTAFMFHRGVYSRLRQIVSNIDKMLRHVTLQPPQPGSDEIALLDKAIYDTATAIAQLEKFRAETAEMMAAKLNAPLTKVAAGITALRKDGFQSLSSKGDERLKIADEQVQRLQLLLQDLMSLDRLSEAHFQLSMSVCNLSDITNGARAATAALAEGRHILIKFNVVDTRVYCDQTRLTQVVINLLSNAVKFSPDNSEIEVDASGGGESACISVLDHGRGIAPEFATKIFHRFEQAAEDDKNKGSGLGLAISRDLVEAHGGTMTFESKPGRTKFVIRFPLKACEDSQAPAAPRAVAKRDGRLWRKGLILLAVPLIMQLSVVGSLYFMVHRAEQQIQTVRISREAAYHFNDATVRALTNIYMAMLYNASRARWLLPLMDENLPAMNQHVAELKLLTANSDNVQQTRVARLADLVASSTKTAKQMVDEKTEDISLRAWLRKSPETAQFIQDLNRVASDVAAWVDESKQREATRLAANEQSRQTILTVLRAGLLASVLASVALAITFTRGLCVRISRIVENSRRLLRNEPLLAPDDASIDEVSTVDTEFFAAAKHLRELDRFRQELLSVTSHELRTPLTSLLGNFDMLGTGIYGTPTDEGAKLLDESRDECARLVETITKFLDEEKARAGKLAIQQPLQADGRPEPMHT